MAAKTGKKRRYLTSVCRTCLAAGCYALVTYHLIMGLLYYIADLEVLDILQRTEKWFVLILLAAAVIYALFASCTDPGFGQRAKRLFDKIRCPEWGLFIFISIWFILSCTYNLRVEKTVFRHYDWWLFDNMVCTFLFFPLGRLMKYRRVRKKVERILHLLMIFYSGFTIWALSNVFHQNPAVLPTGEKVRMMRSSGGAYTLYAGMNRNIFGMIELAMIAVAVYMILTQMPRLKIIYGTVLVPHLLAAILTNSRATFLGVLALFSALAMILVWKLSRFRRPIVRFLVGAAAAAAAAVFLVWFRTFVFSLYEAAVANASIDLFGEPVYLASASGGLPAMSSDAEFTRAITTEDIRVNIWVATLYAMFSSPEMFLFGVLRSQAQNVISETMAALYGTTILYAHAHNVILQVGICIGVPGMIAYLACLFRNFARCVKTCAERSARRLPVIAALSAAMLGMVVENMFEAFLILWFSVMASLFFLFCGWMVSLDEERKKDKIRRRKELRRMRRLQRAKKRQSSKTIKQE